jgi:hypothetical protein
MEDNNIVPKLMLEIDNMYIIKVLSGRYTGRGSFFAISEDGKEFHANKQLVEKKAGLIEMLSKRTNPLWILVKDEIWGPKWGNIPVSEIILLSEKREVCEDFKAKLAQELQIRFELFELHELHLKLIEGTYTNPSFHDEEKRLLKEKTVLEEKLALIQVQLEKIT